MGEVGTIGWDLAKNVFQAHGADVSGAVLFREKLRRHQVFAFFTSQPPCTFLLGNSLPNTSQRNCCG